MNELFDERCRVCKCTTNLYDLTFDYNKNILDKLESFVFVEVSFFSYPFIISNEVIFGWF